MKVRQGFVSNSSSTSFLIGTTEPISFEFLCRVMRVEESPAKKILESLARYVSKHVKQLDAKKWCDDHYSESVPPVFTRMAAGFPNLYSLSVSNCDDGEGNFLYEVFQEEVDVIKSAEIEMSMPYGD